MSGFLGLPRLTSAQQRVVLSTDQRLLVGAGAGSGKTSTIVQKLCYLLGGTVTDANGVPFQHPSPIRLSDIAAITYTNEAAADLKRKLRAALIACGLRALASDIDGARIGTIHGFCGDLLQEFALRGGLPPALSILSEGEAGALSQECARLAVRDVIGASVAETGSARTVSGESPTVSALTSLLDGRTIKQVTQLAATIATDSDQLSVWTRNAEELRPHEQALLTIGRRAHALRVEALSRTGARDFESMIVAVRDLLRTNAQVRHAVQRALRLLVVDEFQDVDPAQRDIAFLLSGLEYDDPAPSSLVLVGDPKQSIYRFRRADVSLWNGVSTRFSDSAIGRHLELTDNFRSRQGILDFVDIHIGARLDQSVNPQRGRQSFEVDYQPLVAAGADAAGDYCVELIAVPASDIGKARRVGDVRTIEAHAVAARARALSETGVGFGEMALLLTSLGEANLYRDAMLAAGVPVYVLRSEGFWESREVLDCLLALRAIRDQRDDVAVVGFLKGPFVGLRDDTLLALRLAEHPDGLFGALETMVEERDLCDRAMQLLSRFSVLRDRVPVQEILNALLRETAFLAFLREDSIDGAQAVANVRKLLRVAESAARQSLGEFLRSIADTRARDERVGQERLYRERADVLTITTVHSAKGLEWPVVFWCDLVRDLRESHESLQRGRQVLRLKLASGFVDADGKVIDAEYAELKAALREEQLAERLRIWYVAATRAKRMLVLSGVALGESSRSADSMSSTLLLQFPALRSDSPPTEVTYASSGGTPYRMRVHVAAPSGSEGPLDAVQLAAETADAETADSETADSEPLLSPAPLRVPQGRRRLSATQLAVFARDRDSWYSRYVSGHADPSPHAESHTPWTAAQGSVVHDVLERVTLARFDAEIGDIEELVADAVERLDPAAPESGSTRGASYRQRVGAMIMQATDSAEWRRVALEPSARRELSFTRVLADGSTIEGAMDMLAMRDGHARILDVKTGAARGDELLAHRHAIQAAVYQEATHAIAGVPSTFALLSAVDGRVVEVEGSGTDVHDLVRMLRE